MKSNANCLFNLIFPECNNIIINIFAIVYIFSSSDLNQFLFVFQEAPLCVTAE